MKNDKNIRKGITAALFATIIVLLAFSVMSTTVSAYNGLLQKEVEGPLTICDLNTETQWTLVISVTNPFEYTMENTVITDRFGAEIEIDEEVSITHGTCSFTTKGKSEKVFLTWNIGDILEGETAQLILLVSTDLNPAGKQEYSTPGVYEMNSGATLKFNDLEQKQHSEVTDSIYVTVGQNILTNPGGETGDMSGWTIIASGGDGWDVCSPPLPWCAPYEGDYNFATSWGWCKRSQEVDLLAEGYTEAQLDTAPTVCAKEWFGEVWDADYYYLKVELRDVNHNIIDSSWYSGICITPGSAGYSDDAWYLLAHTFSGYGPGVRYIYWEDGSIDSEYWTGHYGAKLDAACLIVVPS